MITRMDYGLKNKIALVTGSSRGIGAAIAKKFAQEGAVVIIHHRKDHKNASQVLKYVQKFNTNSIEYSCDVRNYNNVQQMANYINQTFGKLDILVNNAGIVKDSSLKKMKINSEWNDVLQTNLDGVMYCCKTLIPIITKNTGKIINISSMVGILGNYGQCAYAASKAGVIGLTLSLAKECAKSGISVNAVLPGFINTSMLNMTPPNVRKKILSTILFKRFGKPEDVASLVCFLCSKECSYITGQMIIIDGGLSINSV